MTKQQEGLTEEVFFDIESFIVTSDKYHVLLAPEMGRPGTLSKEQNSPFG